MATVNALYNTIRLTIAGIISKQIMRKFKTA